VKICLTEAHLCPQKKCGERMCEPCHLVYELRCRQPRALLAMPPGRASRRVCLWSEWPAPSSRENGLRQGKTAAGTPSAGAAWSIATCVAFNQDRTSALRSSTRVQSLSHLLGQCLLRERFLNKGHIGSSKRMLRKNPVSVTRHIQNFHHYCPVISRTELAG
jgi:hypothetical protein